MKTTFYPVGACFLALLTGCATPKEALNQANHGVALISQMELELKEFRRIETASEQAHLGILAQQKAAIIKNTLALSIDNRARQAAGAAQVVRQIDSMTSLIQGMADDEATVDATQATVDKALATLLAPLPSTTVATTASQTALADLGKELPFKIRAEEFKSFVDTVKKSVDDNKKKIKDAENPVTNPAQ
ncbi:MAG: hypothetical protein ACM31P_03400 [Actinomycetota bacterium]